MTALVFALQPDMVHIAMDTLVVKAVDKKPVCFQRKILSIADNNLLIVGTGHAEFINGWFGHISYYLSHANIDELNQLAPNILHESVSASGGLGHSTATLYHFGFSEIEAKYVGYAYRSELNFSSQKLQYGLGLKPQVKVKDTECIKFPDFLIEIIRDQQRFDQHQPITQQVGIGGEIDYAVLENGKTSIKTVDRFESYENESKYIERNKYA